MEEFRYNGSKTYGIRVGCGKLYITLIFNQDGTFHRLRIPRNTKFNCSLMMRDGLAKEATYKARRDIPQTIKDFKGRKPDMCCEHYNMSCQAYSCRDAIAKTFEKEYQKEEAPKDKLLRK